MNIAERQAVRGSLSRWWIVVAGALGCSVGAGIAVIYAFPILAVGFSAEFGWDRSVYQYCLTSFLLATGGGTIALGAAIERWGVRRPAIVFITVFSLAIASLALLPACRGCFYGVFALLGITGAAATAMPYAVAVSGWFNSRRGLALGLVNTGAGVGATLAPHYAQFLQTRFGWRAGFLGAALAAGLIALFGLIFLLRDPPGLRSRAGRKNGTWTTLTAEYLRDQNFWLIAIPILGISVATFGVMGSLVPLLKDRGITGSEIASALSMAGVSSWLGRVATGYLLDRLFAPYLAALIFLLALLGVALIAGGAAGASLLTATALTGLTLGAEGDLVTFLVSRYFSLDRYSNVLGAMWIMWAWGGGMGTYLVGTTFSLTHSYRVALLIFATLLALSCVLVCRLGPYSQRLAREAIDPSGAS